MHTCSEGVENDDGKKKGAAVGGRDGVGIANEPDL